jgi:hypothetical protein
MANNLGTNIENRFVLVRKEWFSSVSLSEDVRERVFLAQSGFGCQQYTMGNAVVGEFVVDGERTRVEGYDLDERFATEEEVAAALDLRKERMVEQDNRLKEAASKMGVLR